jgi:hypothetical protein
LLPPYAFVAALMEFTVVSTAQRHRDFVGDLYPKSAWLRKAQVARIAGLAAADKAGLFRHEAQVLFVPRPPRKFDVLSRSRS